ncbi:hypothetical protein [Sphingopyxis fribergensis]
MFDLFQQWRRLAAAGVSMQATGVEALKTMSGAGDVIVARGAIMSEAARSPLAADHGELGRMVPEKVAAASRAGSDAATLIWDNQSLWQRHMRHLGVMVMRCRPPTFSEWLDLAERNAALMVGSVEASAKIGSASLAPFSRQVKANARRLAAQPPGRARRARAKSH